MAAKMAETKTILCDFLGVADSLIVFLTHENVKVYITIEGLPRVQTGLIWE